MAKARSLPMMGDPSGIDPDRDDPTIITPNKKYQGKGMYVYAGTKKIFGKYILNRVLVMTQTDLPPWIVLWHEIGHIYQAYKDNGVPANFADKYSGSQSAMEKDNLAQIEHPLCDEAKIPKRLRYKHTISAIPFFEKLKRHREMVQPKLFYLAANAEKRRRIDEELQRPATRDCENPEAVEGLHYNVR